MVDWYILLVWPREDTKGGSMNRFFSSKGIALIVLVTILSLLVACGADGSTGPAGPAGESDHHDEEDEGHSDAVLSVSPAESGGTSSMYGAGFGPGETVSITAGGRIIGGATANDDGAFAADATVTLSDGMYTATAVGSDGSEAIAPLLIASK